ncbi:MAG TPA: hypothetical protein PLE54_06635 [Burkholderiaceae bacterium]|nr:hypothetical protein [Burkholderiaceae bacterium]HQR70261.1 hypothetical protein [Burkholderiaceae bacterium]
MKAAAQIPVNPFDGLVSFDDLARHGRCSMTAGSATISGLVSFRNF